MTNAGASLVGIDNVWIQGEGIDNTILLNGGFTKNATPLTTNCAISDLTINANSNASTCVNLATNCVDFIFERVKMMNSSSSFLFYWSSVDHLLVDKCIFIEGGLTASADNCAGSQIKTTEKETVFRNCYFEKTSSVGGGMLTTGATGNLLVDGCQMWNKGVDATSYAAVSIENSFGTCKEVRIVNCRGFGRNMGFVIGNNTTNQIDRGQIRGCISTDIQKIAKAKEAIISDGIIYNSAYGYFMMNNTVAKLNNCIAKNTNFYSSGSATDKGGFYGADNVDLTIDGLHVYDDQGTGTTPFGIRLSPTGGTNAYINNCTLIGPFVTSPLHLVSLTLAKIRGGKIVGTPSFTTITTLSIRDVSGYVTEAQGTNTITSGNTSIAVTHGLSYTPTAAEIGVTFTENPTVTPGMWWPSAIGATTFTVNVRTDPGASNLDFSWSVRRI